MYSHLYMYTHEYRLVQFRIILSGPAQDLSLFILQFIIRTCTCRPGIVSQYMYLTDSIEIKLMCHYYEQQPTNKTHSYM